MDPKDLIKIIEKLDRIAVAIEDLTRAIEDVQEVITETFLDG